MSFKVFCWVDHFLAFLVLLLGFLAAFLATLFLVTLFLVTFLAALFLVAGFFLETLFFPLALVVLDLDLALVAFLAGFLAFLAFLAGFLALEAFLATFLVDFLEADLVLDLEADFLVLVLGICIFVCVCPM